MYKIYLSKHAQKDGKKIAKSTVKDKVLLLLDIITNNPYQKPYEKLEGVDNVYSKRINIKHRLVYQIYEDTKEIKILRMWTHYGDN